MSKHLLMIAFKHIGITLFLLLLCSYANAQDHYISIVEENRNTVNTIITRTVSIDKVVGDTIYAYASDSELAKFKNLGFTFKSLPYPSSGEKSIVMATTIDQMASWDKYPTYEVYREMMKKFETDYPTLCKLDSIGTTVKGRKLYVVKISNNVLAHEAEPEFFYTSTMHGDETTGYILMLRLIDHLLANYGTDARATKMVDNLAIFINPNANPDGTYNYGNHTVSGSKRYNANNVDINRNFPDPRVGENPDGNSYQPETVAMIDYAASRNFVMSANFHGGIELANFPWDAWTTSQNAHPDHDWFYTVSRQYAGFAQANSPSGYFTAQNSGVTQGGDWYVVSGSRQDYMNYWHSCREITLEISYTKNPPSADLPLYWNYNQEAMLSYIENMFAGIQGTVTNTDGDPLNATITITDHDKYNSFVTTNPQHGNYVRPIEPGTWDVTYSANGYKPETKNVSIENYTSPQIIDVVLTKLEFNVTIEIKNNNTPIQNALVTLNEQNKSTNENGLAHFTNTPEGQYNLTIAAEGFDAFNENIIISSDTTLKINLIPLGIRPSQLGLNAVSVWPNPFSNTLNIDFTLHQNTNISIELFSVFGQKVTTIYRGNYGVGKHTFRWNKTISLPTCVYLVKTTIDKQTFTKKIIFAPK